MKPIGRKLKTKTINNTSYCISSGVVPMKYSFSVYNRQKIDVTKKSYLITHAILEGITISDIFFCLVTCQKSYSLEDFSQLMLALAVRSLPLPNGWCFQLKLFPPQQQQVMAGTKQIIVRLVYALNHDTRKGTWLLLACLFYLPLSYHTEGRGKLFDCVSFEGRFIRRFSPSSHHY